MASSWVLGCADDGAAVCEGEACDASSSSTTSTGSTTTSNSATVDGTESSDVGSGSSSAPGSSETTGGSEDTTSDTSETTTGSATSSDSSESSTSEVTTSEVTTSEPTTSEVTTSEATTSETTTSETSSTTATSETTSATGESSSDDGGPGGCGDGALDPAEACDDANAIDGDGCDADCTESVVVDIAMGASHTCVLLDTGRLKCWGAGWQGALGQGDLASIGDDETPAATGPVDLGDTATWIDGGSSFACAITGSDDVRCWGSGDYGQLAHGATFDVGDDELPSALGPATLADGEVVHVSVGERNGCATYSNGDVACWGTSGFGEHGYGHYDTIGDDEPVSSAGFVSLGGGATMTAVGGVHSCALLDTQEVVCWGYNSDGRLGYGIMSLGVGDNELPSDLGPVDTGVFAESIVAGESHTCVLFAGLVKCWGNNSYGALGRGNFANIGDDETPIVIGPVDVETPLTQPVVQLAAGSYHTCALMQNGTVRCWGWGIVGQLGLGDTQDVGDDELPSSMPAVDVGGTVVRIAAGGNRTCALLEDGAVRCWGGNFAGELGYGHTQTIGNDESPSAAGDIEVF